MKIDKMEGSSNIYKKWLYVCRNHVDQRFFLRVPKSRDTKIRHGVEAKDEEDRPQGLFLLLSGREKGVPIFLSSTRLRPPTIDGFHQSLTCSLAVTTRCTTSKKTSNSSSSSPAADAEIRNRRKSNTRRVGNAATLVILSDLVASHP